MDTPWTFVKEYHCSDCAASNENWWFEIRDVHGRTIQGLSRLHDENLAALIVSAVNDRAPVHLQAEIGTLKGELGAQTEVKVTLLREFAARVQGIMSDYENLPPESDETWESWFAAAFDLAGDKISKVLDEAITDVRSTSQHSERK